VDESATIRTQMGKHSKSIDLTVVVYGTPCAIPPPNSNIVGIYISFCNSDECTSSSLLPCRDFDTKSY
jgi:hypothetical protein